MSSTCIIVPCYNESVRLKTKNFLDFVIQSNEIEFLFVNDGSTDDTKNVLENLCNQHPSLNVLHLNKNVGKAEAVRKGINYSNQFEYIGFWDADLSTPLSEIISMLSILLKNSSCNILVASRIKRMGASITRNPKRHYLGRVFSTLSSLILKLPIYDSQCGAKLFRAKECEDLFQEAFVTSWLFDIEILIRYRNKVGIQESLKTIQEYPLLKWMEVGGSKLNVFDFLKVPSQLMAIHMKYN